MEDELQEYVGLAIFSILGLQKKEVKYCLLDRLMLNILKTERTI